MFRKFQVREVAKVREETYVVTVRTEHGELRITRYPTGLAVRANAGEYFEGDLTTAQAAAVHKAIVKFVKKGG